MQWKTTHDGRHAHDAQHAHETRKRDEEKWDKERREEKVAKIIHFPKNKSITPQDFVQEISEAVKENPAKSIMVACKLEDGSVMTGYFNCDFGTKQELVGHIQCDIIDQMIRTNSERY